MRMSLLVGGAVAIAAAVVVWFGEMVGLELESVVVLGMATGAVVALVHDSTLALRLVGLLSGVAIVWGGYFLRAGFLPDTSGGRAVAVLVMLGLCTAVAVVTAGRVPLWTTFVGAAAMFGAYEAAFTASPPEVTDTSIPALTALLTTAAIGFLIASLILPENGHAGRRHAAQPQGSGDAGRESDLVTEDVR